MVDILNVRIYPQLHIANNESLSIVYLSTIALELLFQP